MNTDFIFSPLNKFKVASVILVSVSALISIVPSSKHLTEYIVRFFPDFYIGDTVFI